MIRIDINNVTVSSFQPEMFNVSIVTMIIISNKGKLIKFIVI